MKKVILFLGLLVCYFVFAVNSFAQKPIQQQVQRDPILEADALQNLEVARHYFRTKKAYKAVLMRFEETFAAYPDFSRMDEFLYLAGMSSYYLANNKGKQKIDFKSEDERKKYAPEKLREDTVMYMTMIVENFPQSPYRNEAEKLLKELQATK